MKVALLPAIHSNAVNCIMFFLSPALNRIFSILFVTVFFCMLVSCEEEGPIIDLSPPNTSLIDTTYMDNSSITAQDKGILLEDFTGVRCPNCPKAQDQAATISAASSRVVVVAIHPGLPNLNPLTAPRNGSKRDMRNYLGGQILDKIIGVPASLPYGDVNRKLFPGEPERYVSYQKWQNYVNSELLLTTPANIYISSVYDSVIRELLVDVKVHYNATATDSGDHYLTLYITESDIIDLQDDGALVDTFYQHNHVLDSVVTPYSGVVLNAGKDKGRVYIKQFKITLPPNFVAKNCEIVAFVHQDSGRRNVVHVMKKDLL